MKNFGKITTVLLVLALFGIGFILPAQAQMHQKMNHKTDHKNVGFIIKRLETNTDQFRSSLDVDFDNTNNDERREAIVEARVAGFEFATDRLRDRVADGEVIPSDIENILSRALMIEQSLQKAKVSPEAKEDWKRIRMNLDNLAKAYNVSWVWSLEANPYWKNAMAAERVVDELERSADDFHRSFIYALDASRLDGTKLEDKAAMLAKQFEDQVDDWEDLADTERLSQANVELLLKRGAALDTFMLANNLTSTRAWRDWNQVKLNLDVLAMMANVDWRWEATPIVTNQASQ